MGLRKPQVSVSVEEDQKERWESAVENDPQYSTLADLIRRSVEKEISDDSELETDPGSSKDVSELKETVEALQSSVEGLSGEFTELKGIVQNQQPTNQNLKSEAFAILPDGDMATPLTPEEVTEQIGGPVDTKSVSQVLEELSRQTAQVESIIGPEEGDIRYRKKGE